MSKSKLTVRQQRFAEAYTGNATEAALIAGYSAKTAHSIGAENLKKPEIMQAIRKREEERMKGPIANRQTRQEFWTAIMQDEARPVRDRLKASELLARSEGDFLDRVEAGVHLTGPPLSPAEAAEALIRAYEAEMQT